MRVTSAPDRTYRKKICSHRRSNMQAMPLGGPERVPYACSGIFIVDRSLCVRASGEESRRSRFGSDEVATRHIVSVARTRSVRLNRV